MEETIIKVKGMVCEGCENRVKNALSQIEGVNDVEANHETGIVKVNSSNRITEEKIKETITDIGFEVE